MARGRTLVVAAILLGTASAGSVGGCDEDGHNGPGAAMSCWPDDPPGSAQDSLMLEWGAACESDADCKDLIGDAGVCMPNANVFELPGGYCSKKCHLPDYATTVVQNDPACDPDGGVDCVGQKGIFERCVVPCTTGSQCHREGYFCRQMPVIAQAGDPNYCLMDECCEGSCGPE